MHLCAEYGQAKLFENLKNSLNCELDIKNNLEETPFTVAAREGRINILRLFYNRWPDQFNPDLRTQDGWTAFNYACINGFLNTIQFLYDKGVNVHTSDRIRRTSLHWAAKFNNYQVVELLLKLNLSLAKRDRAEMTPQEVCLKHGARESDAAFQAKIQSDKRKRR